MSLPVRGRRLMGEINVVPYIDVMLVLLIIFMITAPLLTQGIEVQLPTAHARPLDPDFLAKHDPLILSVDVNGRYFLNVGEHIEQALSSTTLLARATAALRRDPARPVLVKADTRVAFGGVVHAMVLLQRAGANKVGFVTDGPIPAAPLRPTADAK
jgi:biopolymer transport protein TolR